MSRNLCRAELRNYFEECKKEEKELKIIFKVPFEKEHFNYGHVTNVDNVVLEMFNLRKRFYFSVELENIRRIIDTKTGEVVDIVEENATNNKSAGAEV